MSEFLEEVALVSDLDNMDEDNSKVTDSNESTSDTAEVNDMEKELESVKTQLVDAQAKIESLTKELEDTKANLDKANEELKDSQNTMNQFKDKCVALASANKELIVDNILKSENIEDDKKDARKNELLAMSMKDLNNLTKETETKDNTQTRTPANVTNPSLSSDNVNDNNGIADVNKKTADDKAKKTVDDFAQDIVSKLVK